jgi:hypothetical protein
MVNPIGRQIKLTSETIKDVVSAYLYSIGAVNDDEDILDLHMSQEENGMVQINFTYVKENHK